MSPDTGFSVALLLVAAVAVIVLALVWLLLPFAMFGIKPLLRELLEEQRRNNQLLLRSANTETPDTTPMRESDPPHNWVPPSGRGRDGPWNHS